jgi:hypothetical protein
MLEVRAVNGVVLDEIVNELFFFIKTHLTFLDCGNDLICLNDNVVIEDYGLFLGVEIESFIVLTIF